MALVECEHPSGGNRRFKGNRAAFIPYFSSRLARSETLNRPRADNCVLEVRKSLRSRGLNKGIGIAPLAMP